MFGEQPGLQVDNQSGLFIEGAYVSRSDEGDGGIDIILVGSDPTFAGNDDQTTGEFLRGVSRYAYFTVPGHTPIKNGPFRLANDRDGSLFADRTVIVAAMTLALQSVQYLRHPLADVTMGYDPSAPKNLVAKAQKRGFDAQLELDWKGYPSLTILGADPAARKSSPVAARENDEEIVFGFGR
ncbi:hypothetical 19.5 kDa protein (plasmid) [Sinorhizobium fredii NGR234]|uniref:Uncharacterized protein y4fF n=1 Tax=Sinorhizobium fredii (strain NBRC 101917 / NGR234) TaxID=394 RepID=Y4FF_SINFN|nr:hypothetical protein [Sinorhizobium fredii]P55444.1 RecName: Full=Uncharacterized protein y4fF [Sinorhizobium fredii NGR234]AAB91663.1 hypothetical 19.5 kDa protein [Sinorhizobium fredii NGR234]